jgi:hypothetical protein
LVYNRSKLPIFGDTNIGKYSSKYLLFYPCRYFLLSTDARRAVNRKSKVVAWYGAPTEQLPYEGRMRVVRDCFFAFRLSDKLKLASLKFAQQNVNNRAT